MEKKPCKFSHRCQHEKMGLVICFAEVPQPVEKCVLYVLMEDREKKEARDGKKLCKS